MSASCPARATSLDLCPTQAEIVPQLLALLPRGRAWGRHDGGPFQGSVLWAFWSAVALVFEYANARICALRREFFCATMSETREQWLAEYGYPDGCDPYPDLCAKVAAQGGTRCDYYAARAALAGWNVRCVERGVDCGAQAGCSLAGGSVAGHSQPSAIAIVVSSATSPAYVGGAQRTPPQAGCLQAGMSLACPPDLAPLVCVLERIVHADVLILYQIV